MNIKAFAIGVIVVGVLFYLFVSSGVVSFNDSLSSKLSSVTEEGLENRIWMHKFNANEDGHYFTDGEGYYFSSEEKNLQMYSDVDKEFDEEKGLILEDLGVPRIIGEYAIDETNTRITRNGSEHSFSVQFKRDTLMWGWRFAQMKLTLNKVKSKEVYTFFHPKSRD